MAYMQFYDLDGFAIATGAPEVALLAPDKSTVSLHPEDPANSGGLSQDLYALPQSGQYTLIAQGTPGAGVIAYYKLSYFYQPAPIVTSLSIIPADYLILPVVKGGTTVLDNLTVQISPTAANIPVIFKMPDKEYLFFTGADGKATASGLRTPKPPVQNRALIYPAGHLELKQKFNFVLIEGYSREDLDGDGLDNDYETANGTEPFNPLTNGTTLDGYPLSSPAPDDMADGDGMGNSVELILGTNPNALDSDTDGYPDGFEVMNQMDPMSKDAANIKVMPLAAELG